MHIQYPKILSNLREESSKGFGYGVFYAAEVILWYSSYLVFSECKKFRQRRLSSIPGRSGDCRGWAKQETEYSGHFNELLKTDRFSYSSIVQLVPLCSNFYLADLVCFYSFGRFHFMIFCISEIVVQKTGSHYRHHQHFSATWMSDNQENEIMEQYFDIQLLFFEFVYGFMK